MRAANTRAIFTVLQLRLRRLPRRRARHCGQGLEPPPRPATSRHRWLQRTEASYGH